MIRKFKNNTRMIILCGGRGKRMGKITDSIPKPMVKIGKASIIEHKISYYKSQGLKNFTFCLGYKANILKKFLVKKLKNSNLNNGGIKAGILKRIFLSKNFIKGPTIISYGDTLAKINFKDLILKHRRSKCVMTIVVAPIQNPFGIVNWDKNGRGTDFNEKPILNHFLGYAVINDDFFEKINKKFINMKDGKGIVESIKYFMKKKQVNIYKFNHLQITINSPEELKNARLNYKKYFTF